jgi:alpha-tubulin suppressor-like RCC1 family protein
MNQKFADEQA